MTQHFISKLSRIHDELRKLTDAADDQHPIDPTNITALAMALKENIHMLTAGIYE